MLTDMLNKAYSNLIFVRDAKDTAYLVLKLNKASNNTVGILTLIEELLKHRFYLVLGSSLEIGASEDSLLSLLYRSKDKVKVYLVKLIVKALAVSIVEIGLSDLSVVAGSGSTGSTNFARSRSRGTA